MLTPIEQMAESFHAAPDPGLPEHVRAAADCEPYQPWAVAHMHIAHNVSILSSNLYKRDEIMNHGLHVYS